MQKKISFTINFFLLFLASITAIFAQNKQALTSSEIVKAMQNSTIVKNKLIVKWKEKPNFLDFTQRFALKNINYIFNNTTSNAKNLANLTLSELSIYQKIALENITEIEIPQQNIIAFINYLQVNDLISYVEPINFHKPTEGTYTSNDPLLYSQWNLEKAKVYDAWNITKGNSQVKIGIVDSGVLLTHLDLKANLAHNELEKNGKPYIDDDKNGFIDDSLGYDFGDNDVNPTAENQHGTQVAGICSAKGDNGIGIAGVAFNCRFLPIKIIKDLGWIVPGTAMFQGIKYAADEGCQIINLSYISYDAQYYQYQQDIIDYVTLVKKSLLVVSAGNSTNNSGNTQIIYYPSSYNNVLSVAASDVFDKNYENGNYNFLIDLTAPGITVQSTQNNGAYSDRMTGSSYAAPFVAGAAALLKSKFPELTGLQIGELLRVSTDDIYNYPENAVLKNKLGTGRINVMNAFNQRNTAASVRYRNLKYANNLGNYAFAGDSLELTMSLTNFLRPVKNLKINLETVSANATVILGDFAVDSLNSLDTTVNELKPFKIYISKNAKPSENIIFKLNFTANGYADYQYFILRLNDEVLTLDRNEITISTAANGRLGYVDETNKKGAGILAKNMQLLKEAGLMLGINNRQVSNAVLTLPNRKANHFTTIQHAKWEEIGLQHSTISSEFSDNGAGNNKIGLLLKQKITERINTPHHQYVLVEYDITNQSNADIDSLSVGLFADFNLQASFANRARWNDSLKIAYTHNNENYVGIRVFGGNSYHCLSIDKLNNAENPTNFSLLDSFSTAEKYFALTNGLNKTNAGTSNSNVGSDVAQVVSTKISLLKGQNRKVTFVIMAGNSLLKLQEIVTEAEKYAMPNPKGNLPIVNPFICSDNLAIQPKNGNNFRFYQDSNLGIPIYIGKKLAVKVADTTKTYYISNVDAVVESELLPYKFKVKAPKVVVFFKDSLNIFDSTKVNFHAYSTDAINYEWTFGDGSAISKEKNPIHSYKSIGNYRVQLTIKDSLGCSIITSSLMRVVRFSRSLTPILPITMKVCAKEPVLIQPKNGTNFSFYLDSLRGRFLGKGKTYLLTDIAAKRLFVTNIDSAVESSAVKLLIDRTFLDAQFLPSAKADTILFEDVTFSDRTLSQYPIIAWEWDFGDNKGKSNLKNPKYLYDKQGIYRVKLKVWDLSACSDTISKVFKVGKKSPLPVMPKIIVTCPNTVVRITPQRGTNFEFYDDIDLTSLVFKGYSYSFYPTINQKLYVICTDSLVESEVATVDILINKPVIKVTIPKVVKLYENILFSPKAENENIVSWLWNFGDGKVSTASKPEHQYQKQGNYAVKVVVTDNYACSQTFIEYVTVINRAANPIVESTSVCEGQNVVINPKGGTLFNFYDRQPSANVSPLQSGSSFTLINIKTPTNLYITNIDSLVESLPTIISIAVKTVEVDFDMNLDTINIYEKDTLFLKAKTTQLADYQWLVNGTTKISSQNYFSFTQAGIYNVVLIMKGQNACVGTKTKKIIVINENTDKLLPYTKFNLYPNPSLKGDVTIDLSLRKANYVQVSLYNTMGQLVNAYSTDYFKDKIIYFNFDNYATGLYLLKVDIGNKQVLRKILIE